MHPLVWPAFQADYHAVARYILPFANRYEIQVASLFYGYPILHFHLGDQFPYQRFLVTQELPRTTPERGAGTAGTLYVLEPFQKELYPLFRDLYPHARLEEHKDPFGRLMFASILVPRGDLEHPADPQAAREGFLGAYYANEGWQGPPAVLRREPTVIFHFHWEFEALPGAFTADWAADLRVEQSGAYMFHMLTSGPTVLLVDGARVIETRDVEREAAPEGSVRLSAGSHRIVVRCLKKGYFSTFSLLWQPPSGHVSAIPMRLLEPLSSEEYARVRATLPLPRTR